MSFALFMRGERSAFQEAYTAAAGIFLSVGAFVRRRWLLLYIPFVYRKTFDHEKLSKGEYYMAVVFSSSRDGAYFEGAVGSTLIIDEAKLILEGDNE